MNIATPALLDKAKNKNNPTSGLLNSRPVCFYTDFVFVFEPRDETTLDHAIEKNYTYVLLTYIIHGLDQPKYDGRGHAQ